jgi:uncharacterized DUF497 family protein
VGFEWDEGKSLENRRKHGFGFARVLPAFSDPLRREYYDSRHSGPGEERFLLAGYAGNAVLLVSFTEPGPGTVRVISARKATVREVELFYNVPTVCDLAARTGVSRNKGRGRKNVRKQGSRLRLNFLKM